MHTELGSMHGMHVGCAWPSSGVNAAFLQPRLPREQGTTIEGRQGNIDELPIPIRVHVSPVHVGKP